MTRHDWVLSKIKPSDTVLHVGAAGNDWELDMRWSETIPLHHKIWQKAKKTIAVDISHKGISELRERGYEAYEWDVEFSVGLIPWSPIEFDVIVVGEVIEHLTNFGDAIDNLNGFLSDDGKMVFTTPNMLGFWSFVTYGILGKHETHEEHVCGFKSDFINNLAERHGLDVDEITYADADDLGKRRFKWLKQIPERLWPHTKPILCFALSPLS